MMKKTPHLFCMLFCLQFSIAASANTDWTLELLMQKLSEVKTLKAEFEEVKDFAIFSDAVTVKGWLNYIKPNYLERQIETPHRELTVIEDDVIKIEREAGAESEITKEQQLSIDVHPAVRTLIESIRATFAGDLMVLKKYYSLIFSGNQSDWLLTLQPLEEDVKEFVRRVEISGSDKSVKKIKTIEADDSESEITIIKSTFG